MNYDWYDTEGKLKEEVPPGPDDILGTKDVARLFGVSTQAVRNMIKKGKLKGVLVWDETHSTSRYEIRRGDLPESVYDVVGRTLTPEELQTKDRNPDGSPLSPDDLLSPKQVAHLYGVGVSRIYHRIRDGDIPASRGTTGRGRWQIRRGDLLRQWV